MSKTGTFSKEGKSARLFSTDTLERCAVFIGGEMKVTYLICDVCKKQVEDRYGTTSNMRIDIVIDDIEGNTRNVKKSIHIGEHVCNECIENIEITWNKRS